jgi:ABC-type bacteriocin/lantibiotic exporter with double-glycine peptidase domain
VGENGTGKTTLVKLLVCRYDLDKGDGRVEADGTHDELVQQYGR